MPLVVRPSVRHESVRQVTSYHAHDPNQVRVTRNNNSNNSSTLPQTYRSKGIATASYKTLKLIHCQTEKFKKKRIAEAEKKIVVDTF